MATEALQLPQQEKTNSQSADPLAESLEVCFPADPSTQEFRKGWLEKFCRETGGLAEIVSPEDSGGQESRLIYFRLSVPVEYDLEH